MPPVTAPTRPDAPVLSVIRKVANPVTRSTVRIEPPFRPETRQQEDEFLNRLYAYLKAGWDFARLDPAVVGLPTLDAASPVSHWPGIS